MTFKMGFLTVCLLHLHRSRQRGGQLFKQGLRCGIRGGNGGFNPTGDEDSPIKLPGEDGFEAGDAK